MNMELSVQYRVKNPEIEELERQIEELGSTATRIRDNNILIPIGIIQDAQRYTSPKTEGRYMWSGTDAQWIQAVVLYAYLQYTALQQKEREDHPYADGSTAYASISYLTKALHWHKSKVIRARRFLFDTGYIEEIIMPRKLKNNQRGVIRLLRLAYAA